MIKMMLKVVKLLVVVMNAMRIKMEGMKRKGKG
jgi:hypothetical protein